jgi:hypothetical protein
VHSTASLADKEHPMNTTSWTRLAFAGLALTAFAANAGAGNLLSNPAFNTVGPKGPVVTTILPSDGVTAAADWQANTNTPGVTFTELLPSTLVDGGTMMHVITDGDRNGVFQAVGDLGSGPRSGFGCVWLYLVGGRLGLGIGNVGNTNGDDMVLNKKGSWEVMQVSNGHSPVNTLLVFGLGGPAEFYIESAQMSASKRACAAK